MPLLVVTVLAAVVAGCLGGGRLGNLTAGRLRRGWLAVAGLLLQALPLALAAAGRPAPALGAALVVASYAALLVFAWSNRLLPGMPLTILGLASNAAVIAVNGAMPVSPDALRAVGGHSSLAVGWGKHRMLDDGDRLTLLADILPLPALGTVVSVGDLLLAAGIAVLVTHLMRSSPSRRQAADGGGRWRWNRR